VWAFIIGFFIMLWAIGFLIWLLAKWFPPGNEVHHPPENPL
jgi:hypothetical protein